MVRGHLGSWRRHWTYLLGYHPKAEALLWKDLRHDSHPTPPTLICAHGCHLGRIYSMNTVKKNSSQSICLGKGNEVIRCMGIVGVVIILPGIPGASCPPCTLALGAMIAASPWGYTAPLSAGMSSALSWAAEFCRSPRRSFVSWP